MWNHVCPKCGSQDIVYLAATSAQFEIKENGEIGDVLIDQEGCDCINQCVSIEPGDVEVYCRNCKSSFQTEAEGDLGFSIGEEV